MKFDKINNEYENLKVYLNLAHSQLYHLILDMDNFLNNYYFHHEYDDGFVDNVELQIVYLEHIYEHFDKILELYNKLSCPKFTPKTGQIYQISDYMVLPQEYEKDIWVNSDDTINLEIFNREFDS